MTISQHVRILEVDEKSNMRIFDGGSCCYLWHIPATILDWNTPPNCQNDVICERSIGNDRSIIANDRPHVGHVSALVDYIC